ncbi:fibronectin type III domain-containing protein [Allomuricauda ruestringensis DSM 13258]|uniref:Fibronectin type III domain-containing protein n=1 Tax=Allomuricauda ruestringensis (strain DSM 13258 / CIP 107369 / LMG 19739 / B1) TaxID=886377 RepID=G2PMY4_ALLRU|nr:Ig-like domain-containing protein [Allomuricauda ruestringensis]AEM71296.1 fibronectin type III domain-containing protein [Allomuricauda ruestringensis DSM 13258]
MKIPRPTLTALLSFFVLFSCSSDSEDPAPDPDTVAPTLNFTISGTSSGSAPIVVSDQMEININAQDANGITKVEVFIDNEKVGEDTSAPFKIIVDLSGYTAKSLTAKSQNYTLRVNATDTSENTSSKEQTITIESKTQLITINFPAQVENPELVDFYIFASRMSGEFLGIAKLESGQKTVSISTIEDIGEDEEYMLTFAQKFDAYNGETNQLATIQNIKISVLKEINIKNYPIFSSNFFERESPEKFLIEGFWDENTAETIAIGAQGFDYGISGNNCSCNYTGQNNTISIARYNEHGNGFATDKIYFNLVNTNQNTAQYAFLDKSMFQEGFKLIPELFSTEGMSLESFEYLNLDTSNSKDPNLKIFVYEDGIDYLNNIFHTIYPYTFNSNIETEFNYWLDNNFTNYITELIYLNYKIDHTGQPYQNYNGNDWTLSHTFQDETFTVNKNTENQDFVGRIGISDSFSPKNGGQSTVLDGLNSTYRWHILFDSQNNSTVRLPVIPEALQEWMFIDKYNSQTFESSENSDQRQLEVIKYESLISYNDYLQKVIQDNEKWYMVSPEREAIFDNPSFWSDNYFYPNHFLFD